MKDINWEPATEDDLEVLTEISIRAFHSDYLVGAPSKTGGPPGYDSVLFHRKMLRQSFAYYKVTVDGSPAGGFWVFLKGPSRMHVARIFIDPEYHRKGIGLRSFRFLFEQYPRIKIWTLDTPKWNIRTRPFYLKNGFVIDHEDNNLYCFVKVFDE